MKGTILLTWLLAWLFSPNVMLAKTDYHPFVVEGKVWNYTCNYVAQTDEEVDVTSYDVAYVLNGDTVIDGNTYKKLYVENGDKRSYCCALRETGKQVWMRMADWGEKLLFDFGMQAGDSYEEPRWGNNIPGRMLTLASDRMIEVNGNRLRVLYYPFRGGFLAVVEGVGSSHGWRIMDDFLSYPTADYSYFYEDFVSCCENGEVIMTANDFSNIPSGVDAPIVERSAASILWGLQGYSLPSPRRGVVIQNGKKRLVE